MSPTITKTNVTEAKPKKTKSLQSGLNLIRSSLSSSRDITKDTATYEFTDKESTAVEVSDDVKSDQLASDLEAKVEETDAQDTAKTSKAIEAQV